MEGGFRRLWSRKKSVPSTDQQARSRNIASSNGVKAPPQPAVTAIKDGKTSTSSRDLQSPVSADDRSRSKSSHRIQPMLVGISRPEVNRDRSEFNKDLERPNTAGSLEQAVSKAADSIARRPSDVSASQPIPISPSKTSSIRHVDIFSIASSMPSYLSRYNEEIAERNLDTYRLVLESTPYVYNPASRYQEEVAIRNAYLPYRSRPSTDTSRRSGDHERTASITTRSIRSIATPQPNGIHSHQTSLDSTEPVQSGYLDQNGHHYRQTSQRSRDGTYLPPIPQEYNEDVPVEDGGIDISMQAPHSPTNAFRRAAQPNSTWRDDRMHTINEGQPYETGSSTTTTSITPRNSGNSASSHVFSDYKISAAEYGQHPANRRGGLNDRSLELRTTFDHSLGPAPPRSATSSTRKQIVLPNRTIMDLTNEDSEFFSETSSPHVSNYSPVIEQAKSDAYHRVVPSDIHTEERRGSKGPQHFDGIATTPMQSSGLRTLEMLVPRQNFPQNDFPQPVTDVAQLDTKPYFESNFSPISTLASWSPRSSAYVTEPTAPLSMTARVQAALESAKAIAQDSQVPISPRNSVRTSTAEERSATYEGPPGHPALQPRPTEEMDMETTQPSTMYELQTPPRPVAPSTHNNNISTPVAKTTGDLSHTTPSIYTSPRSINSIDYVNPSSAFGVRTRDFALSPRETTPSAKDITTPKASDKVRASSSASKAQPKKPRTTKTRPKTNTPSSAKPKDTGFDEEAFKRKQAEARAALERLQLSLNEDFITLPERKTLKSTKGKEPQQDDRQSAQARILSQEPKIPVPVIVKTEVERPPPSSFRTSRGESSKIAAPLTSRPLSGGKTSSRRAPVPSSLKNVEPASNPIDQAVLSPSLLHAIQFTANPPKSPGEISLSSFPVPSSSRPPSQPDVPVGYHSQNNPIVGAMKRRNSTKSQTSTTSAFSIPYHMVPGRSSSVRDPVPEEGDAIWA